MPLRPSSMIGQQSKQKATASTAATHAIGMKYRLFPEPPSHTIQSAVKAHPSAASARVSDWKDVGRAGVESVRSACQTRTTITTSRNTKSNRSVTNVRRRHFLVDHPPVPDMANGRRRASVSESGMKR